MTQSDEAEPDGALVEGLRRELYEALYFRSYTVWFLFDELRKEFGFERTREVLKRGFYRLGEHSAKRMFGGKQAVTVDDVRKRFEGGGGDRGRVFNMCFTRKEGDALDVQAMTCPLKDGMVKMGLPAEEVATVCEIADSMTYGLIESGGLRYWSETWKPGDPPGCCIMHIRPGDHERPAGG